MGILSVAGMAGHYAMFAARIEDVVRRFHRMHPGNGFARVLKK